MTYVPRLLSGVGSGTLPPCTSEANPNVVLLLFDVSIDYVAGLIASIATLVVGHDAGVETYRRHVVVVPKTSINNADEEALLIRSFINQLAEAVQTEGKVLRPIHAAYYDEVAPLLDALWRHLDVLPEGAALYDLLTRADTPRSLEAPGATRLASEVERYCHTVTFPSLQNVAGDLGYRWEPRLRRRFREGCFDGITKDGDRFRPGKARSSKLPMEFYYAAWRMLPPKGQQGGHDPFGPYRLTTRDDIEAILRAKLDAMYHLYSRWNVARTVNLRLRKRPVDVTQLFLPVGKDASLADALATFLRAERVTRLVQWKTERLVPAERRVLTGDTLLAIYHDADQDDIVRQRNQANRDAAAQGDKWEQDGLTVRLRLSLAAVGVGMNAAEQLLLATKMAPGDRVVVSPLHVTDERLPLQERRLHQPSPEQLLYTARAELLRIDNEGQGAPTWITVQMRDNPAQVDGYLYPSSLARPFYDSERITLDPDPNDGFGQQQAAMVRDITSTLDKAKAGHHTLYHWLDELRERGEQEEGQEETNERARVRLWPEAARRAQAHYFDGLREARRLGLLSEEYDDQNDANYIAGLGPDCARLVVAHGPPGCGKSLRASHAIFARLQGALAAGDELRVYVCAPTHAATDALLSKVRATQQTLARLLEADPALGEYFDARLLDIPLFRIAPHGEIPGGITPLPKAHHKGSRSYPANADVVAGHHHAVVAGTPGGIYGMFKGDRWLRSRFHENRHAGLVVLDEAARMGIAEALMAGLPLWPGGQVLVCGDHLQFAPIHALGWERGDATPREPRGQGASRSIFQVLRDFPAQIPHVTFTRTHRCNAIIATFLREAFYRAEGVPLYSTKTDVLPLWDWHDPFVAATLAPDSPLVLILHDETGSERANGFEADLLAPLLQSVEDWNEKAATSPVSVGVVATHRAQRSLLAARFPLFAAGIGTVDAMQGAEFDVTFLSCTESDADYIGATGGFVQAPQRLNVAVSRARKKAVVIASRSVLLAMDASADGEATLGFMAFQALRQTCNKRMWSGQRNGRLVEVWGS